MPEQLPPGIPRLQAVKPQPPAPAKPASKPVPTGFSSSLTNFFVSSKNVIGIDIGFSYIKIAQLQKGSKGYMITSCITRALPQAIRDNPVEKRKVAQGFLKEFVADARVKTKLGRLAVWGKGVFVFSLSVPNLNRKDLKGAVMIELKKRLPFQTDINKMVFDFFVTGQTRDEKGVMLLVTCIAAEQAMLDEQLQFLKEIGIQPITVNVIPDAIGNVLPFCIEDAKKKTTAVLDIGANSAQLNFYKGRELIFSREIPMSGDSLTRALAKTVTTPSGVATISFDDAEKIKRNCGIPLEEEAATEYFTDFGALRGEQISAMLRPTLERLVMELKRTMNYFAKTFQTGDPDVLYLTGGGCRMINFDKFLLYNLEGFSKVERLNILKAVKGWADTGVLKQELVMEQAAPHLAVAFGLCLGNGGKVNLQPVQEKVEQKIILITNILRVLFPFILSIILSLYIIYYGNALKYKVFVINVNASINRLQPTIKLVKEYQELNTKIEQRRDLLESVKGKEPLWSGVLKELSNIIPKEVVINKIEVILGKEPREMHLVGKLVSKYTILDVALQQFVMTLNDSPFFDKVTLVSGQTDMYSAVPATNFEISCRLKY